MLTSRAERVADENARFQSSQNNKLPENSSLPFSDVASTLSKSLLCNGVVPRAESGASFKVANITAYIDGSKVKILEEESYLHYVTPKFRVDAEIIAPSLGADELWSVGFVQAVCHMRFYNTYRSGFSSWEFPEMVLGDKKVINDSDGINHPWYGNVSEFPLNDAISDPAALTKSWKSSRKWITVEDHFFPRISWQAPGHKERGRDVVSKEADFLVRTERYQGFLTWVVAWNLKTNSMYPMQAVYWEMAIVITVDASRPLGQRANVEPIVASQPFVYSPTKTPSLVRDAILPPCANAAQALVYRRFSSFEQQQSLSKRLAAKIWKKKRLFQNAVSTRLVILPKVGTYGDRRRAHELLNRMRGCYDLVMTNYWKGCPLLRSVPRWSSSEGNRHKERKPNNWMRVIFCQFWPRRKK